MFRDDFKLSGVREKGERECVSGCGWVCEREREKEREEEKYFWGLRLQGRSLTWIAFFNQRCSASASKTSSTTNRRTNHFFKTHQTHGADLINNIWQTGEILLYFLAFILLQRIKSLSFIVKPCNYVRQIFLIM